MFRSTGRCRMRWRSSIPSRFPTPMRSESTRRGWAAAPTPCCIDLPDTQLDAAHAQAMATLDLRGAALAIDEAGWKKPADAPGSAKLVIDLEQDRITRLPQIEVKAPGLDGRLAVTTSDGGKQ